MFHLAYTMFKTSVSQHFEIGSFHIKIQISGISQKIRISGKWTHITTLQSLAGWAATAPFRQACTFHGPRQFLLLPNTLDVRCQSPLTALTVSFSVENIYLYWYLYKKYGTTETNTTL